MRVYAERLVLAICARRRRNSRLGVYMTRRTAVQKTLVDPETCARRLREVEVQHELWPLLSKEALEARFLLGGLLHKASIKAAGDKNRRLTIDSWYLLRYIPQFLRTMLRLRPRPSCSFRLDGAYRRQINATFRHRAHYFTKKSGATYFKAVRVGWLIGKVAIEVERPEVEVVANSVACE